MNVRQPNNFPASDDGFSLVEAVLALAVGSLLIGGMFSVLRDVQVVDADIGTRADTSQQARIGLDWLQRDLLRAGVGYGEMVALFPLVVPRADGGVEIRLNPTGFRATLTQDAAIGATEFRLDDATGLVPGSRITVFDAAGNLEIFEVLNVLGGSGRVRVTVPSTRAFLVANGAATAALAQISYFTQTAAGETTLVRQLNSDTAPVATGVQVFTVTYLDDSSPAVVFSPADVASQLRIRAIEVTLEIVAATARLTGAGGPATTAYNTRIVPRVLAMR